MDWILHAVFHIYYISNDHILCSRFDSSSPSVAYIGEPGQHFFQIMAWRQFGLKGIAESIITIEEIIRNPNLNSMSSSDRSEPPGWPGRMHYYDYYYLRCPKYILAYFLLKLGMEFSIGRICFVYIIDSKFPGANMGTIWGWQDLGGPHASPTNLAVWGNLYLLPNSHFIQSFS